LGIFEDEWNVHILISWLATTPTTARVRRIWSWIFDGVWGVEDSGTRQSYVLARGKRRMGAHGGISLLSQFNIELISLHQLTLLMRPKSTSTLFEVPVRGKPNTNLTFGTFRITSWNQLYLQASLYTLSYLDYLRSTLLLWPSQLLT
jgi:hypothetical protein